VKIEPAVELGINAPVQILLIDHSSSIGLSLRDGVRGDLLEQFQVTRKTSLDDGLAVLQNELFYIVLLDLCTSSSFGLESVVRTVSAAKDIPVIVLVSEGETTTASEAIRLGARDYVVPGCGCNSLLRTVRHATEKQQLNAQLEAELRKTAEQYNLNSKLSHDLRNALACIHQFGNILIDGLAGTLSEEQREYIGIILQNASRIRSAVETFTNAAPTMSVGHSSPSDHTYSSNGAN
jgi:DNA-binding NtrC family response regulator